MKAVVSRGIENFKIEKRDFPAIDTSDVLLKVAYCGICGTDIHQYYGNWELNLGSIPGHEVSGTVIEIGSDVQYLSIGDRVALDPGIVCLNCNYCRNGMYHLCRNRVAIYHYKGGGFAEYMAVPERQLYRVPEGTPLSWAAILEPASCCVHGVDRAAVKTGETVVVLGGGAIGLLILQVSTLAGALTVFLVEPSITRRNLAQTLGPVVPFDPEAVDIIEAVLSETDGGADVIFECAGLPQTVAQCFQMVKPGGRIVLFGSNKPETKVEISPYRVFRDELTILGSVVAPNTYPRTLKLIASEKLQIEPLITHILPIDRFHDAIKMHQAQEGIKILIRPGND
jgi:2-desacetyl-2-hydroxyethyl bacteriochlorophyllide A dehydrogenase